MFMDNSSIVTDYSVSISVSSNAVALKRPTPVVQKTVRNGTPSRRGNRPSWITPVIFRNWDKSGRSVFINQCKKLTGIKKISNAAEFRDRRKKNRELSYAISNLVHNALRRTIRRDRVMSVLSELLRLDPLIATLVGDVWVNIYTLSTGWTGAKSIQRDLFSQLTREVGGLLSCFFKERVHSENMEDILGSAALAKTFNQKFIRVKTKNYYKQQKFNLFREEPEGYGKLIAELSQPLGKISFDALLQIAQCLIGSCQLDPNRVLDIILEAFECQPNCNFFIPLLNKLKFGQNTICELLAFKLSNVETSRSLFNLMALLLQHKIITLNQIYPWLKPDDRVIEKNWERELREATEDALQAMKIRLDGKDGKETPIPGAEEEEETLVDDSYADNNKMLLCKALLDIGAWEQAYKLMKKHPRYSCMNCSFVAISLVRFANYMIEPLYNKSSNLIPKRQVRRPTHARYNSMLTERIEGFMGLKKYLNIFYTLGPFIHYDPILLYKLLRVMRKYLETAQEIEATPDLYYLFLDVLDQVVLPALCYLDGNCGIAKEVWDVLQHYPYGYRFCLYHSWKSEERIRSHPTLMRKRVELVKQIKQLMRRLSKENVKFMGRQLGKLSHSMPLVIFDYVLSQIQLFDNMILPVIDALKYLSPLGYDVLGYCLLEALAPVESPNNKGNELSVMLTGNRSRTKHDGSTIAPWVQNLASFAGSIYKKYSLDLVPLLQYIANQLKAKQSLDLLLLKEIIQKMSGIEAAEEITNEQLEAMGGGELLRSEAGYFGQVRTNKKSATRLREAASVSELAVTLCILMAQQRNSNIFENCQEEVHTKLIGKLYDQCQDTLIQFGTFLATSCTHDEYSRKIPPLQTLVEEYHVDSDAAFFLWRSLFSYAIAGKYDELRRTGKSHKRMHSSVLQAKYAEASSFVLDPITEMMKNHLPMKTWDDISPQFYVTFWSLTLYDLFVPTEAYAREISRVKQLSIAASENKDMTSSKRKKEQERCATLIEKLQDEQRRQREHVGRVMAKLNQEKETWFAPRAQKSAKNEAVTAFLQLCLFPRCIFTAPDALYCAHFVTTIHLLSTPNFSTLICYDRVFCDIIYTVTCCTENEANRYGRFLNALLGTVMKWHGNKDIFDKECASYPGFVTKFRAANTSVTDSNDHVDYENYRHVCHKWHYKITKCVIVCLESKDFIQIRNALIVLKRILPNFPKVINLANAVERWVERVRAEQKDKRADLFALATSYIGQLKAKLPKLITEEAFHQKSPEKPVVKPVEPRIVKSSELKKPTEPSRVVVEIRPTEQKPDDGKSGKTVKIEEKVTKVETKVVRVGDTRQVRVSNSTSFDVRVEDRKARKSDSKGSSGHKEGRKKRKLEKEITKASIST